MHAKSVVGVATFLDMSGQDPPVRETAAWHTESFARICFHKKAFNTTIARFVFGQGPTVLDHESGLARWSIVADISASAKALKQAFTEGSYALQIIFELADVLEIKFLEIVASAEIFQLFQELILAFAVFAFHATSQVIPVVHGHAAIRAQHYYHAAVVWLFR